MAIKDTRIQREKREVILDAALQVFSENGFRGATLDQIAAVAGLSKPNMLYYYAGKEVIYRTLLNRLLETWLQPLEDIDASGDPHKEIMRYISAKLEFSRKYPRESRLFAIEILNGARGCRMSLMAPSKIWLIVLFEYFVNGWTKVGWPRLIPTT